MTQGGSNKKVTNKLVVLSSAAVLVVYSAGYARTQSAAEKLNERIAQRRPVTQPVQGSDPANARVAALASNILIPPDTKREPARPVTTEVAVASIQPVAARPATVSPVAETAAPVALPTPSVATPAAATPTATPIAIPAPAPVAAPVVVEQKAEVAPAPPPAPVWKDGTFLGWGTSRHGDIQAEVVVAGGRITSAKIAQCLTRYSCDVIEHLQPQPPKRQSADVDTVSRATESADAFFFALTDALAKAK